MMSIIHRYNNLEGMAMKILNLRSRSLRAPPQASAKRRPSASRLLATRSTAPADAERKRAIVRS